MQAPWGSGHCSDAPRIYRTRNLRRAAMALPDDTSGYAPSSKTCRVYLCTAHQICTRGSIALKQSNKLLEGAMDHSESIISGIVNAVVTALRSTGFFESAENSIVSAPYRKHIIWLKKRSDEASLEVLIKAEITRSVDCNVTTTLPGRLHKESLGYFRLDLPITLSTRKGCPVTHEETVSLVLTDNTFDYSSRQPIVIHAHEHIDISYAIEKKRAAISG
jgi:serine protease inhibitor ecotin